MNYKVKVFSNEYEKKYSYQNRQLERYIKDNDVELFAVYGEMRACIVWEGIIKQLSSKDERFFLSDTEEMVRLVENPVFCTDGSVRYYVEHTRNKVYVGDNTTESLKELHKVIQANITKREKEQKALVLHRSLGSKTIKRRMWKRI